MHSISIIAAKPEFQTGFDFCIS